ncbi:hypothetical protein COLO4_36060 [Corchorus olitorius]|uniref:Uncharacterized protein n=1 Tax=Corchorus olitorius TaxID=93759 RepID=A0A1R3GB43_9ROSI|nr:hypothetical protein COLO4_36060 [Corchorus olitorius]
MEKTSFLLACFIALLLISLAKTEAETLDLRKGNPCNKHKDCLDACSYRGRCPVLCDAGFCCNSPDAGSVFLDGGSAQLECSYILEKEGPRNALVVGPSLQPKQQ